MDGGGGHKSGGFVFFVTGLAAFLVLKGRTLTSPTITPPPNPLPLFLTPQPHLQAQPRHDQISDDQI